MPGLGPRKAAQLLQQVQAASATKNTPAERQELRPFLGDAVYFNAVGFIKFLPGVTDGGLQHAPGLEGRRVHPESYMHARKMCFDAMQDDDAQEVEETEDRLEEAVFAAAMSDLGTCTMSTLDLDEFADHLVASEGTRRLHETLPGHSRRAGAPVRGSARAQRAARRRGAEPSLRADDVRDRGEPAARHANERAPGALRGGADGRGRQDPHTAAAVRRDGHHRRGK